MQRRAAAGAEGCRQRQVQMIAEGATCRGGCTGMHWVQSGDLQHRTELFLHERDANAGGGEALVLRANAMHRE